MKELTALVMRVITEQSLGQLARLADYSVNQVRDLARSTMVAHIVVQIFAGVLAASGVIALSLGWSIFGSGTLEGWDTVFFINCGLFVSSILLIAFTLKKYSRKRNHFAEKTNQLTRDLTDSLMSGISAFQREHSSHRQDDRLDKLEKSIELIAEALAQQNNYVGPEVVKPKNDSERRPSNA